MHLFHLLSLHVVKCGDATILSRCVVLCLGLSWVWCQLSVWWCSKLSLSTSWTVVSRIHVSLVEKELPWVITCCVNLSFLKLGVSWFGGPSFWLRQINPFSVFLSRLDFCRLLLSRNSFSFTSICNSWFYFSLVLLNWCFFMEQCSYARLQSTSG